MSTMVRTVTGAALALAMTATTTGAATAQPTDDGVFIATTYLRELNDSGATGLGGLVLRGNEASVVFRVAGVLAGAPHAQHIHVGARGTCPGRDADTDRDGIISTTEGHPAYGHIGTSLTTTGDTTPASGLATDRFPTPTDDTYEYRRTLTVPDTVAKDLRAGRAVLVVHGIDPNGTGTYDGAAVSDLDPALPQEATAPAACGQFRPRLDDLPALDTLPGLSELLDLGDLIGIEDPTLA